MDETIARSTDPATSIGPSMAAKIPRVASIDAYRGFVMFLMLAEAFELRAVAKAMPGSSIWKFLAFHQSHVDWQGCSLHDLIQPSFSFLVGVSLIISLANRKARQEGLGSSLAHAAVRALILVFLGVFLRSIWDLRINWTFADTLSQIGLGYLPLFLIAQGGRKVWWISLVAILVGYWAAFAAYPLPGPEFDPKLAKVENWPHNLEGLAAHWNKNANLASDFDRWLLNRLPWAQPFTANSGGYCTLNFIPTLATMILGLICGDWLISGRPATRKLGLLVAAGLSGLALGYALDAAGICPSVKRIWTPSWVLFSGGWCFLLMALFYWLSDVLGASSVFYPLRVIGMNSIAAYLLAGLVGRLLRGGLRSAPLQSLFRYFGDAYEPLFIGSIIVGVFWLILYAMYRRRIFLRI